MTEQEAIERIERALIDAGWTNPFKSERIARIAWNEMKDIAKEGGTLPAGWHPAIDGKNKPEAWAAYKAAHPLVPIDQPGLAIADEPASPKGWWATSDGPEQGETP